MREAILLAELSRCRAFNLAKSGGELSNTLEAEQISRLGNSMIFRYKHLLGSAYQKSGDILRRRYSRDALERLAEPRVSHAELLRYILGSQGVMHLFAHELTRIVYNIFGVVGVVAVSLILI